MTRGATPEPPPDGDGLDGRSVWDDLDAERDAMLATRRDRPPLVPAIPRLAAGSPVGKAWLITFADLVALILTVFVMLHAMRSVQAEQWRTVVASLTSRLNPGAERVVPTGEAEYNIATTFRRQAINLDYLGGVLERIIAEDPQLSGAKLTNLDDRLVLSLPSDGLFAPDGAVMSDKAREAIRNVGTIVGNVTNQIGVRGHSDPTPSARGGYTSAWELSLARAAAVANALHEAGYQEDIVVYGVGDSRSGEAKDAAEGGTRRVDVLILPAATGR